MKTEPVIYLDAKGKEHEALVFAENPLNEGYVSLVYIDESKPEADNVVKVFDVRHMDTLSEHRIVPTGKQDHLGNEIVEEEGNKHLPTYHLNCWKEDFRLSRPLPSDHPANDHPHRKVTDQDGKVIPISRPEYDAEVAEHQERTGTSPPPAPEGPAPVDPPKAAQKADYDGQVRDNHLAHLKAVGDEQRRAEAEAAASKPPDPKDVIAKLQAENEQLQVAVDQGSDALFAKDKQIADLEAAVASFRAKETAPASEPAPAPAVELEGGKANEPASAPESAD